MIEKLEEIGIGEIVINSIDNDGVMQGYDLTLVESVREKCSMPITVLGGAGSLDDLKSLFNKFKIIGAAAGSLFVFKAKYKAVLINYPNRKERKPFIKNMKQIIQDLKKGDTILEEVPVPGKAGSVLIRTTKV